MTKKVIKGRMCSACKGEILCIKQRVPNTLAGHAIMGPGGTTKHRTKREYYCSQCGLSYNPNAPSIGIPK